MDPALEPLLEDLASADHIRRLRALDALVVAARDAPEAVLTLARRALESRSATARSAAAQLLGHLRMDAGVGALAQLALDPRAPQRARKSAVTALGSIGHPDGIEAAAALLSHPHPMMRRAAAEAAGRLGAPAPLLLPALGDPAWEVRMFAALGLVAAAGEAPGRIAAALAAAFAVEAEPQTAEQLLRALADHALRHPSLLSGTAAIFVRVLESPRAASPSALDWQVRRAAARGLGELGAVDAAALLAALREGGDEADPVSEQLDWALARLGAAPGP